MSQAEATIPLTEAIPFAPQKPFYQKPKEEAKLEKPHYLFTALNVITSELIRQRRDRPELRAGGMIVPTPCLRHSGNFVRRGVITALLEGPYDPVAREEADSSDQKGAYLELPALKGNDPLGIPIPNPLKTRLAKPGLHLPLILEGSTNVRWGMHKGLVEIRDLRFMDYNPNDLDEVHHAAFPSWPQIPVRIRDFRDTVNGSRHRLGPESYLRGIIEDMLASCEQAELYMTRVIDQIHFEMENPRREAGSAPQYTSLHYVFLEQLGIEPKARTQHQAPRNASPDVKEMFEMFREASKEDREEFIKALQVLAKPAASPEAISEPPAIVGGSVANGGTETIAVKTPEKNQRTQRKPQD